MFVFACVLSTQRNKHTKKSMYCDEIEGLMTLARGFYFILIKYMFKERKGSFLSEDKNILILRMRSF